MVGIIAPMKATVSVIGTDGKTKTKTMMLANNQPVAHVETIEDAVKVTAGIIDNFAKGWHPCNIHTDDDGNVVIQAEKDSTA